VDKFITKRPRLECTASESQQLSRTSAPCSSTAGAEKVRRNVNAVSESVPVSRDLSATRVL